jgi:hypothetical protein
MSERQGVPKMTDPTGSTGRGRLADVLAMRAGRAEPEPPFVIEQREALGFEEGSLDRVGSLFLIPPARIDFECGSVPVAAFSGRQIDGV